MGSNPIFSATKKPHKRAVFYCAQDILTPKKDAAIRSFFVAAKVISHITGFAACMAEAFG
jgi:hypothetical protein